MRSITLLLGCLLAAARLAHATTWDEPWHEAVVKRADALVLARVTAVDAQQGLTVSVLRTLAGSPLAGPVRITDFYALDLCSTSGGPGPEFRLNSVDSCFFFVQKRADGTYAIATPTTGFAPVSKSQVAATYRHSYHKALVPLALYEPTMTAIFQHYHGQPYDDALIRPLLIAPLALPPAPISAEGMATFFRQHVALETAGHLGLALPVATMQPFLRDTTNFHAQASAVRALAAAPSPEARQALLPLLVDRHTRDFVKVLAVQTLAGHQPRELKPQLAALVATASVAEVSFGGDIMDPRVCTRLPSVRKALQALVARL